jgi:hypothetical protein
MWTAPVCDSRNDHLTGNTLLGAGVVHHINREITPMRARKIIDRNLRPAK